MMHLSRFLPALVVAAIFLLAAPAAAEDSGSFYLNEARTLYLAGHWDEANQAFEDAYESTEETSQNRAATALEWAGLLWEQGTYDRAQTLVEEALSVASQLGLDDAMGQLLLTRGHIEASTGELRAAENTLNICIQLTGEQDDQINRALCRINRRMVRTLRGSDPGSESSFQADLATLRDSEAPLSIGTSLARTARLYRDNRDYDRAELLLDEAHRAYESSGNVPAITRNEMRRAELYHHRGDYDEAAPRLESLLTRFETMGNRPMIVQVLFLQAQQAVNRDHRPQAVTLYRRALTITGEIENPGLRGQVNLALCELNFAGSLNHCEEATQIFASAEMGVYQIRAEIALSRTHQSRGNGDEARAVLRRARQRLETRLANDSAPSAGYVLQLTSLCDMEVRLGAEDALETCRRGLDAFSGLPEALRVNQARLHGRALFAAGRAATSAGQGTTAVEYLSQAADIYLALDRPNPLLAANVLLHLGVVQSAMESQLDEAPATLLRGLSLMDGLDGDDAQVSQTHISLKAQLARAYLSAERWEAAIENLVPLAERARRAGDMQNAAWAYSALARAYLQTDRRDEAIAALRRGQPLAEQSEDAALIESFRQNLSRFED